MFAIDSMMRITTVEFSYKPNVQNKQQLRNVSKRCKSDIHCVRNVGNDDLNYFALVSMMRTTAVEIS